jgi:hypothetical protein
MTVEHPAYDLLPAVHRIRDAELDHPLRKLLEVVEDELARLRADVDGLYEDWFVETCADWVVPYIGALLGVPPLNEVPGISGGRALVAKTIGYRRRSGTVAALEQVARDVTGWPARAVEYFALLVVTQHLDHVRLDHARTADLRDAGGLAAVGTPFDAVARNVDVRHIDVGRGRHNLPDIGVHLWRLDAYPVTGGYAREVDRALGRWTFDPAGRDRRLFRRPAAPPADGVGPDDVPAPLSRRALLGALGAASTALTGRDPVLAVRLDDDPDPLPPNRLIAADLRDWTRPPSPAADELAKVAVDPVLGRLTVAAGSEPTRIRVDYAYGFPGDVGAGPHDRRVSLATALDDAAVVNWSVAVSADAEPVPGRRVTTIGAALQLWNNRPDLLPGQLGVIAITDSATYEESLDVVVPPGDRLLIVAAAVPPLGADPVVLDVGALAAVGVVPHLVGDLRVSAAPGGADAGAELVLDGLSVEGDVRVAPEGLSRLVVADCTLLHDGLRAGGWVSADGNRHLAVRVLSTVAAGARLGDAETLAVADSILHAGCQPGVVAVDAASARADVAACTILGGTCVRILTASNTIFQDRVVVSRLQEGCARFSYLPFDSRTPRRYRCQPTSATSPLVPVFGSIRPVDPAFGQLAATCPQEIARGADDEGEMGAYHYLQQPRRMANLAAQLDRYLRLGLEAGFFFAT